MRSLRQAAPSLSRFGIGAILLALPLAAQTVDQCNTLRKHGDAGEAACWQGLTRSANLATRAEGNWGLKNYSAANDLFRDAVKARPKDANLKARWGLLYLEHWQAADAADLFGEALEIDPNNAQALLGMAKVAADQFQGKASEFAEKALKADPKMYEAHEVLARVALEDNNEPKATDECNKAIAISPEALDAMATLATIDWLNDKPAPVPPGSINTASPWIDKMVKVNPHYGEAYAIAAHFFEINRRYVESIAYSRKALEVDPKLDSARSELGLNLMRLGQTDEAYKLLMQSYDDGWRDTLTSNSLKLLDSIQRNFETFKTPTTVLLLDKKEAALVRPYLQSELDRVIATYEKKYKYKLDGPVRVEAYPNHEDFAVRTAGVPGLGILGVTFGKLVAIDSPSASDKDRKPGSFHWDSTLWHEMSHVFTLSMTNHRTPRWFSEGVAVYEETAASPDWGDRLDHPSIVAIQTKKLLPIAELDRGYIHPTYPEQVVVSYFQGGQVITFIVEKWGYDKVLDMIHDYANRMDTPEVIEKEFKMKPEEFDKQFIPWIEAKTKTQVSGFETWAQRVKGINQAAKAKDWDLVIKEGNAIRDIYPDYVEAGSVYEFLAQAYTAKGDKAKTMAELKRYSDIGGRNPDTLKQLATLQAEAGDKRAAATTLERLNLVYVRDDQGHQKLGDLDMDLGNINGAIREYQSVLLLKPVDPANAHYQLARAFHAAKRDQDANDEVLSALEVAPGFKPAQKLLLELSASGANVKQ